MVVQEFIDSNVGQVLGTLFHTIGAIALLGALIGYIAWARSLPDNKSSLLQASSFAAYVAIFTNLLGGIIRTYTSGHPRLTELDSSTWVQLMFVKHLFIFAGMAAAVFLFERVAPRLLKSREARKEGDRLGADHTIGVWVVAASILIASIFGAISQVVTLDMGSAEDPMPMDNETYQIQYVNASGQLTSLPLQPAQSEGSFMMPEGTTNLEAILIWDPTQFALDLALAPTAMNATGSQMSGTDGRLEMTLEPDAPFSGGEWEYVIASELAQVTWSLSIRFTIDNSEHEFLQETYPIPAGAFFEINTHMHLNSTMHWDWTSDAELEFNVHTHFDGNVDYLVFETTDAHAGSVTSNRTGGYSLMWENTGTLPISLSYKAWGNFTVDSYFPPRS